MLRTGTTVLPVRSHDSRSATVTSNYGRAVTILPTKRAFDPQAAQALQIDFNPVRSPISYYKEAKPATDRQPS
jgi:hypothetical protein